MPTRVAVAAEALLDLVDLVLRVEVEGCDDVSGANGARHSFDSSARSTNALAFCLPPLVFVIICFVLYQQGIRSQLLQFVVVASSIVNRLWRIGGWGEPPGK